MVVSSVPAKILGEQLLALGMHGKDDIGAVVHGHLGFDVQGLVEVAVVGVAVFALDGEGGDAFMLGQVGGHVVLGAQGIGGADMHRGPAGLQGGRQHPGLGGDVEAGGDPEPGQGFFPFETLPDGVQDRHVPPGPLHPQAAFVGQIYIFDIVIHEFLISICCGNLRLADADGGGAFEPGLFPQDVDFIDVFPGEVRIGAAEMAVSRGLLEDGPLQFQILDHGRGLEAEGVLDDLQELVFRDDRGVVSVDHDGQRVGQADGVGHLDFAALGQARGHHVFGHVAQHVGGGAVHLGGVFAGEGAAAVIAPAAVGVDDDLAAGDAAVAQGAAHHKAAGGVDQELGVHQQIGRDGLLDHFLDDGLFQVLILDVGVMLGRDDHGMDTLGHAVFIAHRHLGLAVGTQPRQECRSFCTLARRSARRWAYQMGMGIRFSVEVEA